MMLLSLVTICLALTAAAAQTPAPTGCVRWCRHIHNPTEFFCCAADPNTPHHHGRCPQRFVTTAMSNFCSVDGQCQPYEKCCFSSSTQRRACVAAVTNRHQPRVSVRLGNTFSNNFDDLNFPNTYRNGTQGWGNMGEMEPVD
ncbi:uncharacterized protein LOC108677862 [Hyalella azteca]|uniref:Uncharacterized protein LOC108677862 n=1 Tax=Hyalella azteca TaxID=294128 RepID=A0A8B7P677_HYAAZ|nr:uncharacterized protein LOC108677862 [Hyalella azteca]